jgi:hypothetical protein
MWQLLLCKRGSLIQQGLSYDRVSKEGIFMEVSMDKEKEVVIVNRFFSKRLKDRVVHELTSGKKRVEALNRLCHDYKNTLIPEYMFEIQSPNSDYQEIASLLQKQGAPNECMLFRGMRKLMERIYP